MKRVAFVVIRCGPEVNGGAEMYCLRIAERMAKYWSVEVLTTCALDYVTWDNYYPPGVVQVNGVTIRRFAVDRPRDIRTFNALSESIRSRELLVPLDEQESWMRAQGPESAALLTYVEKNSETYDAFVFFSYLYATTYCILPLVQARAYLVPLAHDEWPIYLSMWDQFVQRPRGFVFNTPEERTFWQRRFPTAASTGAIAGVGVDIPKRVDAQRFRREYGIHEPFMLYLGRVDPSKGCNELCEYFAELREQEGGARKLVLVGRPVMAIPQHPDIVSLGYLSEELKWDALAASELLVMPSQYESLSMVLLEAWAVERPVLVNGRSDVLVNQCQRAQGGLWYRDVEEFIAAVGVLNPTVRKHLGIQGKRYVEEAYTWPRVEEVYLRLLDDQGDESSNSR